MLFLEIVSLAASYKCTYSSFAFKNLRLSPLSTDNVHSTLTLCQCLPPYIEWNNHIILICFPCKKAWGHSFIMIRSSLIVQINLGDTLVTSSCLICHKSKQNLWSDLSSSSLQRLFLPPSISSFPTFQLWHFPLNILGFPRLTAPSQMIKKN